MTTVRDAGQVTRPVREEACPAAWFEAFTNGLRAEEALLAMLLPRVAPEISVVAAAALGLQRAAPAGSLELRLEAPTGDGLTRVDMVVCPAGSDNRWAFEWKLLWQLGPRECVTGIQRDLVKLQGRQRSAVIVFAYAVHEAPAYCHARITKESLQTTTAKAAEKLGEPYRCSSVFTIEQLGVHAKYQVLAWVPR
ncbi:hypothetical protein [Polyangium sp. y55x31]|uniref:hypothetical protein n=1 Tax=Polyangium sp. y55x31 TaxID=3042688 RepID=UPI002482FD42|nr:hypothetical protein [Polyangium sp. y55x31]MDI1480400.1 hypothetical protein [Polyangium sp. y55x31]